MGLLKRYLEKATPSPLQDEGELLLSTRLLAPEISFDDLNDDVLASLVRERGIDFTTALFYDRARTRFAPFVESFESVPVDFATPPRLEGRLLLVPAGFYEQVPNFGGGGDVVLNIARRHGLDAHLVPTDSVGTMRGNATIIADALKDANDGEIILFTLSRGAAEARLVFENEPNLLAKIKKWIMISPTIFGSKRADQMLELGAFRKWMIYRILGSYGFTPEIVREFKTGREGILSRPLKFEIPTGLALNLIPCCLRAHLNTRGQRQRFDQVSPFGPNDGIQKTWDTWVPGADNYPVWGADHYMRIPGITFLFYRVFAHIAAESRLDANRARSAASRLEIQRSATENNPDAIG